MKKKVKIIIQLIICYAPMNKKNNQGPKKKIQRSFSIPEKLLKIKNKVL